MFVNLKLWRGSVRLIIMRAILSRVTYVGRAEGKVWNYECSEWPAGYLIASMELRILAGLQFNYRQSSLPLNLQMTLQKALMDGIYSIISIWDVYPWEKCFLKDQDGGSQPTEDGCGKSGRKTRAWELMFRKFAWWRTYPAHPLSGPHLSSLLERNVSKAIALGKSEGQALLKNTAH